MATRRLLFEKPPFRFLAEHLAQDIEFQSDIRRILDLDENVYLRLATQLAKSDAFLNFSNFASIVEDALEKHEDSEQITAILYRIGEIIHDADMDATDAMRLLSNAIKENAKELDIKERQTFIDRLQKLTAEPIGFAKQYKAQRLVEATGAELDTFQFLCDIRPIFDQQRECVDGAIPLTILRLEYTKPDGDSDVVELRVTERQISQFGERIADTKLKLEMIKDLLENKNLSIPSTKATIAKSDS